MATATEQNKTSDPGKFQVRDVLAEALAYEKSNNLRLAAELYISILIRLPNHSSAALKLKKVGKKIGVPTRLLQPDVDRLLSLLQSGQTSSAAELSTALLVTAPREAVLHNFNGISLHSLGELERAERSFKNATLLRPNFAEALGNLGTLLLDQGRTEEAITYLDKSIALKPDSAPVLNSKAMALIAKREFSEALKCVDQILKISPNYATAFNAKGLALKELLNYREAIECYIKGLELDPHNIQLRMNLAFAYSDISEEQNAIENLEKVISIDPNNHESLMRLGILYSQTGRMNEAKSIILRTIEVEPNKFEAYRMLTVLQKFSVGDPEINEMRRRLEIAKNLDDKNGEMHLSFALGKVFQDVGEPKIAFEYLKTGNERKRESLEYSIGQDRELFLQVKNAFTKEFFDTYRGQRNPTEQLIFVVGMMRSGTTLTEQILASHSKVYGAGEVPYVNQFVRKLHANWRGVEAFDFKALADGYIGNLRPEAREFQRVVDKMPINCLWLGYILTAFPNAHIVNLVRDPRDVALSIYKALFISSGNQFSYDLTELGQFYLLYLDLMDYWRELFPNKIFDLRYEDLVTDLEGTARQLIKHCGLDWEDQVLSFQKTKRVVKTASLNQVRQGIYSTSVKGWQMFEEELAPFIKVLEAAGRL